MSDSSAPHVTTSSTEVSIRRAPRFSTFLILGGALGAIVTLVVTMSQEVDPSVGYGALYGYFLLYGLPAGVLLGALVFLVLDFASKRRVRTGTAERTTIEAPVEIELLDD